MMGTRKNSKLLNPYKKPVRRRISVLVCGKGVDGINRPNQQDAFGTLSTLTNASAYSQTGQLFSVVDVLSISGASTRQIAFQNPPANTKIMYLENVSAGISFDNPTLLRDYEETLTVDISKANSVTTGLVLPTSNRNLGSELASSLIVSDPTTFSGLGALSVTRHPTGECNLDFRGQIIVPPGNILLISVSDNRAPGRTGTLGVTVTWYELDLPPS